MSGRIRTIKPELLEDAVTAGLSDCAFRVFVASILLADDYGNFRAEAGLLRGQVYWARDPVTTTSVDEALAELEKARLVVYYNARGQRYGAIRTWSKNQNVQKPGKPRVPSPADSGDLRVLEALYPESGDGPESPRPDHRPPTTTTTTDQRRGTRLDANWRPSNSTVDWAAERGIDATGELLAAFYDFWKGVPGTKGMKLDWDATYRNRLRDLDEWGKIPESERIPIPPKKRKRNSEPKIAAKDQAEINKIASEITESVCGSLVFEP